MRLVVALLVLQAYGVIGKAQQSRPWMLNSLINVNYNSGMSKEQGADLKLIKETSLQVKKLFGDVGEAMSRVSTAMNKVEHVAKQVIGPVAAAVPVIKLAYDAVAQVSEAKVAQDSALKEAAQWSRILEQVEVVTERAAKQCLDDAKLQLVRANEFRDIGDLESLESSMVILNKEEKRLLDKASLLDRDQSKYIVDHCGAIREG